MRRWLSKVFDIKMDSGCVRLAAQQKELSDMRPSGIYASQYAGGYKNWHTENVDATFQALSVLGRRNPNEEKCDKQD